MLDASSTNIGTTILDTDFSQVAMTSDRVLAIFDKLRLSLWRLRSSILVDYEIEDKLADDENRTKLSIHFEDEHFDLDASMLAGQYVPEIQPSLDVKYWCASKLQAWREGEEAKAPASTIHG